MTAGNVGMTDWTNRYAVDRRRVTVRCVPGMWRRTGPHRTDPAKSSATSVRARHHGEDAWAATARGDEGADRHDGEGHDRHHGTGEELEAGVDRRGSGRARPAAGRAWRAAAAAPPPE